MLGDLGLWNKFQFYEGSCGVPLMVRMPDGSSGTCDTPLSLISLSATLTDLCNVAALTPTDGKSFADSIRSPDPHKDYGPVFAEYSIANDNAKYMIRDGRWKYTYWVDDLAELYNLSSDPEELHNLARSPDHAAKVRELHEKLFAWHTPPNARARNGEN